MRTILLFLMVLAAPIAVADETPVSPSEFRAFAEGYTLYFERDGQPFGSESFERGGKVLWRYNDGSCVEGAWRPHGAQLCFLFDSESAEGEVNCWRVLRTEEGGLFARLLSGEDSGLELQITGRDKRPLLCGDPGTAT